jgi:putative phosphoesterase
MRIGILSDIHVDINFTGRDTVTPAMCETVRKQSLDMLIVAGDVAGDYTLALESLEEIEAVSGVPCLYVPGNHDIWVEHHPEKTSHEIYNLLKAYPHNLAGSPFEIGDDWAVIGDLGWYDFSFGDEKYSREDFQRMKYEERVWQDSIMALWDRSTLEMHDFFLNKLEAQLKEYQDRNVIVVTHVLPIKDFTVQPPTPMWEYLNAFLGSSAYGDLILRYPNVRYSISGHVHYRKRRQIGNTEFICSCLGYRSEWFENDDAAVEVDRAMMVIEI